MQEFEDKSSNFHITDVTFAMNMPIGADNSTAAADGSAAASTDTTEDTTTTQETQTTESADTQSTESTESTPETRQVRPEMWKGIMHRLASAMRQVMKD